jgi:recombination protein RecA
MPTAAALRFEIERALERRFPAALSPVPRTIHEVWETGIEAVDSLLGSGLPVGAISEMTGLESSGRTSLAMAFIARRTLEDRPCAWIDVNDAFDPESAAATGVKLRQLLWVRCQTKERGNKGTREQETKLRRLSWSRLDQALRATDLVLQAGGFAAIVLDLGDTAPEQANRIPLATWFRYRQAAERTQCSLVVLGKRAYAQSAAGVALECEAVRSEAASEDTAGETVLRGFAFAVRRGRERFAPVEISTRKPPAATWQVDAAWNAERGQERESA